MHVATKLNQYVKQRWGPGDEKEDDKKRAQNNQCPKDSLT